MKIVIGHLYYDLMNLYGDNGNIKVINKHLSEQGIEVLIKQLSIGDKINFDEFDLIYIGSGTEENQIIVLNDLLKYKEQVLKAVNNNKFFLITGNSLELFGKYITDLNNIKHPCLETFNYYSIMEEKRIVKEVSLGSTLINSNILGFINHQGDIHGNENYLFDHEGVFYNNFYGTYLLGPIMARNPLFLKFFLKKLILNKDKKFKFKEFNLSLDKKAYDEYLNFKANKKA